MEHLEFTITYVTALLFCVLLLGGVRWWSGAGCACVNNTRRMAMPRPAGRTSATEAAAHSSTLPPAPPWRGPRWCCWPARESQSQAPSGAALARGPTRRRAKCREQLHCTCPSLQPGMTPGGPYPRRPARRSTAPGRCAGQPGGTLGCIASLHHRAWRSAERWCLGRRASSS